MIDRKLILSDKEYVKRELSRRRYDAAVIDVIEQTLLELRSMRRAYDGLNAERSARGRDSAVSAEEKRKLRELVSQTAREIKRLEAAAQTMMLELPNLPDLGAPDCAAGNIVVAEAADYYESAVSAPSPHWETAEKLDILDTKTAGKISGTRFGMFKGKGAKLLRALVNCGIELHEGKYDEILPPHLVTTRSLTHTGHLPKFAREQYKCADDDLWLIPTAEVPLTAAFSDTVFPRGALPRYLMGYTLAFRREAGADGRESHGVSRVHEFHKVELMKITEPSAVDAELDDLLNDCLKIIRALRLQYRIVDLCAGEMGEKYARCYDIEVYAPGMKKWLEVSSVGHFSDYQARRAGIRYADERGRRQYAFTMNGSGIATPRVWAAIIETYQQPDGSVLIPEALEPFMGSGFIR